MQMMKTLRTNKFLAWVLVVVVSIPYLASGAMAAEKPAPDIYIQTVLLFPLDNLAGEKYAKLATELTNQLARGIDANPRYTVVEYSERLPAVQRVLSTQPEKTVPTGGPFFSDAKAIARALEMARAMAADIAIVGSLDGCKWDPQKGQATVMGTLEWYDVKTGRKIDTLSATGISARPVTDPGTTEDVVAMDAVQALAGKMISAFTGEEYKVQTLVTEKPKVTATKPKSKKSWLPMLLLSLGVGILLSSGGGGGADGAAGGDESPPPPPSGW